MFVVGDKKKARFFVVMVEFVMVLFLAEFFLGQIETDGIIEWAMLSFVLFFLTSFFTVHFIFKEKVKDYFLDIKYSKKALFWGFIGFLIFIAVMWALVVQLNWQSDISVSRWVLGSVGLLVFFDIVLVPVVVFSKEFFFRGFLLKTSKGVIGIVGAIVLSAILSTVYDLYVGGFLNYRQALLMLIPNLFLGYLAYINRSVIVSALFSWVYILVIDLIFAYKLTQ